MANDFATDSEGGDDPRARATSIRPVKPTRVGPYRIEGELAEGGMGVVYRGVDEGGGVAAIKVMIRLAGTALARFEREAAIHIEHPNIVRIYGSGRATTARRTSLSSCSKVKASRRW